MTTATLALVSLENAAVVGDAMGAGSRDMLLAEFCERVRQLARPGDKVITVAPDKACVLLRNVTDSQQIQLAGAKLVRLFQAPVRLVDRDVRPEIHAAFVPPDDASRDIDQRLRIAESGLREARRRGNVFVIRHEPTCEIEQENLRRTREVETGLARGEFLLFYQPKMHAAYGTVIGAEGLMRWLHPEEGLLGPDRFLPFCEDLQIKRALSWLAIKSALAACADWPDGVGVAVNVPPALICDPELAVVIGDGLRIHGLSASRVTLEVTEEAMLADPDAAMAAIADLRGIGLRIAIGTWSSTS
jgi:predicted signal transduction protein with EAL and GGDEF domain